MAKKTTTIKNIKGPNQIISFIVFLVNAVRYRATKKRLIIAGVIFLAIIAFQLNSINKTKHTVQTAIVKKETMIELVSSSGEITADKLANLSFPTAGKIVWLGVKEGDGVKKYQGLASLDKVTLDATYQQALNMVRKYGATVDSVHDSLKNKDTTETFSEKDTRTTAEATNDYYYNAFRIAEYNLKNATLTAPFDGIVTNFASGISEGINILPGSIVFSVVNPDTVYFKAEVNELDVIKIKKGQKVKIKLDAYPTETFDGIVSVVAFASTISSTGGNVYKIRVSLPNNSEMKFRLGMEGSADIVLSTIDSALIAPLGAVINNDNGNFVWVVENGKAHKKTVKIGASSVDTIQILEGVSEGETVIISPPTKLAEGDKVKSSK